MNREIHFSMACNKSSNYLRLLSICLESVMQHSSQDDTYFLSLLINQWKTKRKHDFKEVFSKYKNLIIQFINIEELGFERPSYIEKRYSVSALHRLYLPLVLPNIEKILYLDCDLLVRMDIRKLYEINIDNYYLAAVKDNGLNLLVKKKSKKYLKNYTHFKKINWYDYVYKILKMNNHENLFNSGVLLMNLKQFRENSLTEKCLKYYEEIKPVFVDQCILNKVCENKVLYLPKEYNLMCSQKVELKKVEGVYKEAKIVHKPWKHLIIRDEFKKIENNYL